MKSKMKAKYTSKKLIFSPFDLPVFEDRVFYFKDGEKIRMREYSLFPPEYPFEKSVMNTYGQTILNSYSGYDPEFIKEIK